MFYQYVESLGISVTNVISEASDSLTVVCESEWTRAAEVVNLNRTEWFML